MMNIKDMSIGRLAITIVVVAALIALVLVALAQFGVLVPAWAITCFWILVVAFVVIFCIRLLLSM